jgi:hypothetical protein
VLRESKRPGGERSRLHLCPICDMLRVKRGSEFFLRSSIVHAGFPTSKAISIHAPTPRYANQTAGNHITISFHGIIKKTLKPTAITPEKTMETKLYSDYVCYEIDSYYNEHPYGPDGCPMCGCDLSKLQIEPSRAMRDKMADPMNGMITSRASFLFTCQTCHWWCVRDACEFIDMPERPLAFHYDYLIFALAGNIQSAVSRDDLESTQPWAKALDDPNIFDEDVVRKLPEGLAALIYNPSASTESTPVRPHVTGDLSMYDPFFDKMKDLITRKRIRKSQKTEPMWLLPGDIVCLTEQTFIRLGLHYVVIASGNIGRVESYEEFCRSQGADCPNVKELMDAGLQYPIRFETATPPPAEELAFLETLCKHGYIYGMDHLGVKIWLLDVEYLKKLYVTLKWK